jgi:hypothetical protein
MAATFVSESSFVHWADQTGNLPAGRRRAKYEHRPALSDVRHPSPAPPEADVRPCIFAKNPKSLREGSEPLSHLMCLNAKGFVCMHDSYRNERRMTPHEMVDDDPRNDYLRDENPELYELVTKPYEYYSLVKWYNPHYSPADGDYARNIFEAAIPLGLVVDYRFNFRFRSNTIFSCHSKELDWPKLDFVKQRVTEEHFSELRDFVRKGTIAWPMQLTHDNMLNWLMDDLIERLLKPLHDFVVLNRKYSTWERVQLLQAAKRKITQFVDDTKTIDSRKVAGLDKERYDKRQNRRETPLQFLKRVYDVELERGLTQAHIRRLDFRLYRALHEWCKYNRYELSQFLKPSRPGTRRVRHPSP